VLAGLGQSQLVFASRGSVDLFGDLTLNVSDLPALHRGDRGVFFLTTTKTTVHRPHDRGFGIVKLDASNHVAGSTTTLAEVKAAVRAAR